MYLEADFGEIVDFADVVEGEFSEVGIGIFPVEVLEMPVGVIISPEEEVIITFAEPNPKPTVNNSKILPIENLAHINRPLILSPAKLVPSWYSLLSVFLELHSNSIIEFLVLGKKIDSSLEDNVFEVIGGLIAAVQVVVVKSWIVNLCQAVVIMDLELVVLGAEVEMTSSIVPNREPKLKFSGGLVWILFFCHLTFQIDSSFAGETADLDSQ